jgi:hypothetical protein
MLVASSVALVVNAVSVSATSSARWSFRDVTVHAGPSGRIFGGATDLANGTTVLYGGATPSGGTVGDTWVYSSGQGWVAKCGTNVAGATASCGPGERSLFGGLAQGPNGAVLFGGGDQNGGTIASDTWVFNGATWHQVCSTGNCGPSQRVEPAIAGNGHQVVMFGGLGSDDDTWIFNGTHWTETCGASIAQACGPPATAAASMAWDGTHFILFGGSQIQNGGGDFGPPDDDTWVFNGTSWNHACGTSIGKPCGPHARALAGFTTLTNPQSARRGAVMAGGGDLFGNGTHRLERDAWLWRQGSWTQLTVPWTSSAVTFTDPGNPPAGSTPLLGLLASQPSSCGVLYQANTVTAVNGTNVTLSARTLDGGWDLTGAGTPTGCTAPATTTTTTSPTNAVSPAKVVDVTTDPATLPQTGSTSLPLALVAFGLIGIGIAAISCGDERRTRRG